MKPKPEDLTEADARSRALGLLARREHSAFQLRTKLVAREFPSAMVDSVIRALTVEGLLDEGRYADAVLASHFARGNGPMKIRATLASARLPSELIAEAFAEFDGDWLSAAKTARRKRFGQALPVEYAEVVRQARFLASRGFTSEQARAACQVEDEIF